MKEKYLKENFAPIVATSDSLSDIARRLGLKAKGGNINTIRRYVDFYGLDTSHFNPNKTGLSKPILKDEELFINNVRVPSRAIKQRLLDAHLKEYKCEICGQEGIWNGKELTLELHHVNGNHFDNRLENLQILCPNCHSQTDTYRNRNASSKMESKEEIHSPYSNHRNTQLKKCAYCGKEFKPQRMNSGKFCSRECYLNYMRDYSANKQ